MKLVFAVVHSKDAPRCSEALSRAGIVSTRFASAGGFLEQENVTLMVGVDDPLVDQVVTILRETASEHLEKVASGAGNGTKPGRKKDAPGLSVEVGGAVFVVDVDRFEKL